MKNTLSSLPIYFMSLFVIRRKVAAKLEKIQRDFLWGGGALEQKSHLVRWAIVRLDKQQGGLGIRDLIILNETLLGKWFWRFASERDPLWKRVIVGKYGQVEGGWCSKVVREGHGVGVWKAIRGKWEMFKTRTGFTIGFGNRVKF